HRQPAVERHAFGRLPRPPEVAGNEDVEALAREALADGVGLRAARVGERAVARALHAALDVPARLAMAHDDEAGRHPFALGAMTVWPPMNATSAFGIVTEPSAFWQFSRIATSVRPTASPEPLSVCTSSFLPCAFLKRACRRRAWKASQFETELISRYVFCAGSHTSRSCVFVAPKPM